MQTCRKWNVILSKIQWRTYNVTSWINYQTGNHFLFNWCLVRSNVVLCICAVPYKRSYTCSFCRIWNLGRVSVNFMYCTGHISIYSTPMMQCQLQLGKIPNAWLNHRKHNFKFAIQTYFAFDITDYPLSSFPSRLKVVVSTRSPLYCKWSF